MILLNEEIKHYALASEVLDRFKNEEFNSISYKVGSEKFKIDFDDARQRDKKRIEEEENAKNEATKGEDAPPDDGAPKEEWASVLKDMHLKLEIQVI